MLIPGDWLCNAYANWLKYLLLLLGLDDDDHAPEPLVRKAHTVSLQINNSDIHIISHFTHTHTHLSNKNILETGRDHLKLG